MTAPAPLDFVSQAHWLCGNPEGLSRACEVGPQSANEWGWAANCATGHFKTSQSGSNQNRPLWSDLL